MFFLLLVLFFKLNYFVFLSPSIYGLLFPFPDSVRAAGEAVHIHEVAGVDHAAHVVGVHILRQKLGLMYYSKLSN